MSAGLAREVNGPQKGGPDHLEFRAALGSFATGVTVVTAPRRSGGYVGLTCNSFSSVSLTPPLILWSLSRQSASFTAFVEASHFAVSVLSADQVDLSRKFSKAADDKFCGVSFSLGAGDAPLLDGAVAHFECRNERHHDGGDHVIFIGRVLRCSRFPRSPLIFCQGQYGALHTLPPTNL